MRITLSYVSSLNGRITRGGDPDVGKWSSKEDQRHLEALKKSYEVIIRTNVKKDPETRNIVLTRNPEMYKDKTLPGELEFTNEKPRKLVKQLEKEGYKRALLAAGPTLSAMFLKEGLIDEFYLTLEPKVFGRGREMFPDGDYFSDFELIEAKKLNDEGTMLLKYKAVK